MRIISCYIIKLTFIWFIIKDIELPNELELNKINNTISVIKNLKDSNVPQRKFLRKDSKIIVDRQSKVRSTLLEYDQKNILLNSLFSSQQEKTQDQKKKLTLKQIQEHESKVQSSTEELNLKTMIDEMANVEQRKVFLI